MLHLIRLLVFAAFTLSLTAVAEPAPADPSKAGPWAVGHSSFTATDTERADRALRTDIWYPVDPEDAGGALSVYPLAAGIGITADIAVDDLSPSEQKFRHLLVFSHGFGGTNTQSTPLLEILASHGFIVVSPEHTGNTNNSDPVVSGEQAEMDRVPDVRFIIDFMLARARTENDVFYQRIHPTRVGVLGHSFGGGTTMGMELGFGGADPDPRVVAILPVSGSIGADFFTEEQLASVSIPTLLMGGTEDTSVPIEENARAFSAISGSQPVYRVDLVGAGHTHFANVCALGNLLISLGITIDQWPSIGAQALIDPFNETCTGDAFPIDEAIRLQNLYSVAFFKTHVSGDLRFARFLTRAYSTDNEPLIAFDKKAVLAALARFKYW
ncbi:MAG: alpha/beta hydrolase family protein [Pseudomonadales bacterium]